MPARPYATLPAALALLLPALALAADWPQWRGPDRNGIVPAGGPRLADAWPDAGPPLLWTSEKFPTEGDGSFSSPVVADGRVYVYVNWKIAIPIPTRTVSQGELNRLGLPPAKLPQDLLDKVENARTSEERAKLKGRPLQNWAAAWAKENLPDDQKKFARFAQDRIRRGDGALSFDELDKLASVKDKPFATQKDFETWLKENAFSPQSTKTVLRVVPRHRHEATDNVFCLSADDGKTLWKKRWPGTATTWGSSSTACIADGRCYVAGTSTLYCLDAKTGDEIWKQNVRTREISSSFLVHDGKAVIVANTLVAYDAAAGQPLWEQKRIRGKNASPVLWKTGDRTLMLCAAGNGLHCVDPADGNVLWTVQPGDGNSTPALSGDTAALMGGKGLAAFRLAPDKAEQIWHQPKVLKDRGASCLIADGHVYGHGGGGKGAFVCAALQDGSVTWQKDKLPGEFSSPVLADGKLFVVVDKPRGVLMLRAVPGKCEELARAELPVSRTTTPAVAGTRLYLRTKDGIACYDITPQ